MNADVTSTLMPCVIVWLLHCCMYICSERTRNAAKACSQHSLVHCCISYTNRKLHLAYPACTQAMQSSIMHVSCVSAVLHTLSSMCPCCSKEGLLLAAKLALMHARNESGVKTPVSGICREWLVSVLAVRLHACCNSACSRPE